MSTQLEPHLVLPPTQVSAQPPEEQTWPVGHTTPSQLVRGTQAKWQA